ncbi:MAG: hypothetical protein RQ745_08690, partial [Longimicrobiales bacterium]|nr:hypothetical protein [Longimicrobiales bacterium]
QRLLAEVGGEAATKRLEAMMERLREAGAAERRRTLDELGADQEGFRERIEEALERLERAALEQDLRNVGAESERIAKQEDALAEALGEGGDPEDLAARQDELIADADSVTERLAELARRLQEAGDAEGAERLEEARSAGEVAREGMQSAQELARQDRQEAAGRQAASAAEALDAQARALRDAQRERMREAAEAWRRALVQASEDALALAREGERIRKEVDASTSPFDRQAASVEIAAVRQGVENLTERMAVAQRLAGDNDPTLASRLGAALERLDGAMSAIADRGRPRAGTAEAGRAVDALNDVALAALAAQRALEQSGEASESMDPMEQLEEMAQRQADLNNQAAEMMPMPMPEQMRRQQMQQMARQQQEIAADLGQMSNQEGDEGPLADLRALGEEAEALARELEEGRLEPGTRERQERLFHRLLDAGRSLEKEEESTERESATPGEVEGSEIPGLTPDALRLSRFGLPDAAALNRLPPAMWALVRGYFERLNRDDGGRVREGGGR